MQWTYRSSAMPQLSSTVPGTRTGRGSLVLLVAFLVAGPSIGAQSPPQQIIVRFLDATSGKPIRKYPVTVTQWNSPTKDSPPLAKDVALALSARTDREGAVVVKLTDPLAKFISVVCFDLSGGGTGRIDLGKVVNAGIVLRFDEQTRAWKSEQSGRPGEILIRTRKLTLWERMRRELP
jgi:hypothetical protein